MTNESQISALEKLVKLRESGALTEEEFTAQKAALFAGATNTHGPFYRRLWFVVLLTCLLITFPLALLILATGQVYRKKQGALIPIKNTTRLVYASALAIWFLAVAVRIGLDPKSISQHWAESAPDNAGQSNGQTAANGPAAPDACDRSDVADMVKSAVENSALSNIIHVKVIDYGHPQELFFDKKNNTRYCQADAELNTGSTPLSYKLYFGPSGGELVEVQKGADAYGTNTMVLIAAGEEAAAKRAQAAAAQPTAPSDTAQAAPEQPKAAGGTDPSQASGSSGDPLDGRYSAEFKQCMATGDAAQGSTQALLGCTDQEIKVQDSKLNTTYQALMASLPSDKQNELRDSERTWIKQQNGQCPEGDASQGTMTQLDRPSCVLSQTIMRTMALERTQGMSLQAQH